MKTIRLLALVLLVLCLVPVFASCGGGFDNNAATTASGNDPVISNEGRSMELNAYNGVPNERMELYNVGNYNDEIYAFYFDLGVVERTPFYTSQTIAYGNQDMKIKLSFSKLTEESLSSAVSHAVETVDTHSQTQDHTLPEIGGKITLFGCVEISGSVKVLDDFHWTDNWGSVTTDSSSTTESYLSQYSNGYEIELNLSEEDGFRRGYSYRFSFYDDVRCFGVLYYEVSTDTFTVAYENFLSGNQTHALEESDENGRFDYKIKKSIDFDVDAAIEIARENMPNKTPSPTEIESAYTRVGNYVFFGEYPQTIKSNAVGINETIQDDRGYYLGSDGAYYAKVTATPYGNSYSFSTGASVKSGTVYYFKVEPIKWRILSESDGVALLLCDGILTNHKFHSSRSNRTIDGKTAYPNNYKESDIRNWLNVRFYRTAFSALEQKVILTTTVDNSPRSTNPNSNANKWNSGKNDYACADTEDKVFLLSLQEASNPDYGFNASCAEYDPARRMIVSDYGRAVGVYISTRTDYYGIGWWWLRSPLYHYSLYIRDVNVNGRVDYDDNDYYIDHPDVGIVPALRIRLGNDE